MLVQDKRGKRRLLPLLCLVYGLGANENEPLIISLANVGKHKAQTETCAIPILEAKAKQMNACKVSFHGLVEVSQPRKKPASNRKPMILQMRACSKL